MGGVDVFGGEYSMRVWLNPVRMEALGISSQEVISAISTQNIQASIGSVGSSPGDKEIKLTYTLQTKGRLNDPADFANIIVRSDDEGGQVHLRDVGQGW